MMRLSALLNMDAALLPSDPVITQLCLDSRQVTEGSVFLACQGSESHGLDFLDAALQQGASAIVWEPCDKYPALDCAVPHVAVEGLSQAVGDIAARFYGHASRQLSVMGVTGTDGKSSCVYLYVQAAELLGRRCGMLGTLGFGLLDQLEAATHTTPDPVGLQAWLAKMLADGARAVSMEVSSHALDQGRINGVELDIAAFTNLSRDHLDYHGDLASYARAKRRLFERAGLKAVLLNVDDAQGRQWAQELAVEQQVVSYAVESAADIKADRVQQDKRGLRFDLTYNGQTVAVNVALLGRFNVYNLLLVAGALLVDGFSLQDIAVAFAKLRTVPGRIEAFEAPGQPLVVVDYAHTPEALSQVLKAVAQHKVAGRLVCVFGCGGNRDAGKRPQMVAAAAAQADHLVLTDDNPRHESPQAIMADMLSGLPEGQSHVVEHDRASAIRLALADAQADDIVVVAGKGHEDYQQVGDEKRSFSDRHFVAAELGMELAA